MNDYKKTRDILNEMSHMVIFPSYTTKYSLNYILSRYFGLDKKTIDKIYNINSRSITILKHPLCAISEKEIFLLNN